MSLASDLLRKYPPKPFYPKSEFPGVTSTLVKGSVKWRAQSNVPGVGATGIGTFDTEERAYIAHKLYRHWLSKGFSYYDIPRQPRTVDAI